MKVVFLAGVIHPVASAHRFVNDRRTIGRRDDLLPLVEKYSLVFFQVSHAHGLRLFLLRHAFKGCE